MNRTIARIRFSFLSLFTATAAAFALSACILDELTDIGSSEEAANLALVAGHAGAWSVDSTLEGNHDRGTVVIGFDGSVDFDTNLSFGPEDYLGVHDRLDVVPPPHGPHIEIEINPVGDLPQRRIRLFVDVETEILTHISYYPDVDSDDASTVQVSAFVVEE
jgi:hypothetical protein